jgi:hypothetical protein
MKPRIESFWNRVNQFWFSGVDARVYALIRIVFALVALANLIDLWPDRHAFFAETGMIDLDTTLENIAGEPRFSIFYYATSETAVTVIFVITAIALVFLALGIVPRLAAVVAYLFLLSYSQRAFPVIHGWDIILRILGLFVVISPIGHCWRLPLSIGMTRPWLRWKPRLTETINPLGQSKNRQDLNVTGSVREMLPRYGLCLMQIQLLVIYWQTLWLKLADDHWRNGDYISYFMLSMYSRFPSRSWAEWQTLSCLLTYGTLLTEFFVPLLLWIKPTRRLAFLLGVGFHLGILVATNLWLFSLVILIPYFAFLDNDDIAKLEGLWQRLFGIYRQKHRIESDSPMAAIRK